MEHSKDILLGEHFEEFVDSQISEGRYSNMSEVIRAGLRLLEEEENRILDLKSSIQEGFDSGFAEDFDPIAHLNTLKTDLKKGE
ncbi:type II toxin-antitoxin system ParD family antitoxin [Sphingobacterium hungaricum]|uniref:Type II toxin-antitoxin system ParD family antitoxin n=1 Tax=Sphingobacterium hungaricum TaxID=2082723 RepID=A0A928YQS1_9SPHI|nr:type II toxin-antitoxin system ParD family antitoxin [Sphingobacterium hungaricum]MBE8713340.1 type II toxin-antitoxin system ParD family antitoxin [Sphingobacterium hungaricum]